MWMERFKQFMGFPLLATNIWLLWVLQVQQGSDASLALLALFLLFGFAAWVYGVIRNSSNRLFVMMILLLTVLLSVGLEVLLPKMRKTLPEVDTAGSRVGIVWVPFSSAALGALREEGKPVFLDFTASWCLTCQFNEKTAINVPAVRTVFKQKGIIAMKGDWTNSDPAITAALKSFGRVGVPLAVYYPPGKGSEPIVLPELLTEKIVLDMIGR
jgi:thiol:disulfide interchange protein DsbD